MRKYLLALSLLLVLNAPLLAEDYLYVADHNIKKLLKMKMDGTVVWDAPNGNGHDIQVLPNKNLLIVNGREIHELDPKGALLWKIGKPLILNAESAQRLPNGNTVIADLGPMKVYEINKENKVIWEYQVPNDNKRKQTQMRQVRRLENGNTLISASTEDKVLEVSPDKKIVWSYPVPFPYLATRLPNGNTLISSGDGYQSPRGWYVIEVDQAGKTVWKYGGADAPKDQQMKFPSGHIRLANGNTMIAEAQGNLIREVTPEKKLVRMIRSPAMKHPCTIALVSE